MARVEGRRSRVRPDEGQRVSVEKHSSSVASYFLVVLAIRTPQNSNDFIEQREAFDDPIAI
jgi:hypothetical protein